MCEVNWHSGVVFCIMGEVNWHIGVVIGSMGEVRLSHNSRLILSHRISHSCTLAPCVGKLHGYLMNNFCQFPQHLKTQYATNVISDIAAYEL